MLPGLQAGSPCRRLDAGSGPVPRAGWATGSAAARRRGCGAPLRCSSAMRESAAIEALAELLVLLVQASQLDDDLVEEVIDLVLVVALAELGRLEPLVDYVFRRQGHSRHLKKLSDKSFAKS